MMKFFDNMSGDDKVICVFFLCFSIVSSIVALSLGIVHYAKHKYENMPRIEYREVEK